MEEVGKIAVKESPQIAKERGVEFKYSLNQYIYVTPTQHIEAA